MSHASASQASNLSRSGILYFNSYTCNKYLLVPINTRKKQETHLLGPKQCVWHHLGLFYSLPFMYIVGISYIYIKY